MKNSIKNVITVFILSVVLLTGSSFKSSANDISQFTILSKVKKVNKINVSGNVELILVQSADESVKVYNDYFAKNALVQQKNNELRISSFEKETLTVVVYVTNLSEITASNNATVKTYGKFNTLDLTINLNDYATAVLNTNTISLSTYIKGNTILTLSGTTTEHKSVLGSVAKVNLEKFTANHTDIKSQSISKSIYNAEQTASIKALSL